VPAPAEFTARRPIVYAVPPVRPETVIGLMVVAAEIHVVPPSVEYS
jgi:hypothetical protein